LKVTSMTIIVHANIKVDVAAILHGIAAIIWLLA
jgi:hypothetical protein